MFGGVNNQIIVTTQKKSQMQNTSNSRHEASRDSHSFSISRNIIKIEKDVKKRITELTNQRAYWAFFKIESAFFVTRVTWSKLRVKNEFSQLFMIHIPVLIQPLRPCIPLINHLPPPTQLIPHQKKNKEKSLPFSCLIPQTHKPKYQLRYLEFLIPFLKSQYSPLKPSSPKYRQNNEIS